MKLNEGALMAGLALGGISSGCYQTTYPTHPMQESHEIEVTASDCADFIHALDPEDRQSLKRWQNQVLSECQGVIAQAKKEWDEKLCAKGQKEKCDTNN